MSMQERSGGTCVPLSAITSYCMAMLNERKMCGICFSTLRAFSWRESLKWTEQCVGWRPSEKVVVEEIPRRCESKSL